MKEGWGGSFYPDQTLNFNCANRRFRLILPVPGFVYFKTKCFFFPSIFYCFLQNILIVVVVFLY